MCLCVSVRECACIFDANLSECVTIDETLAKVGLVKSKSIYMKFHLFTSFTLKNDLVFKMKRKKICVVKILFQKKKFTAFTQNCLFMNSPSNTCKKKASSH